MMLTRPGGNRKGPSADPSRGPVAARAGLATGPEELERFRALRGTPILAGLGDPQVLALARAARRRDLKRRQALFFAGDPADQVYVVLGGALKVSRVSADGHEVTLTIVGPGELCGELALVEPGPRATVAEALQDARVLAIPVAEFNRVMGGSADLAAGVARRIGRRLREAEELVEDLASREVPARLARLLLRLAEQYGAPSNGTVALALPLAHQDLAHCIGSTRETTTIVLNDFRRRGLIEMAPRRIVIKSLGDLRARA
jgi:CRP/FNR family transcriptional regulator